MSTSTDNTTKELAPIESYPSINALLEDYKRRATIRVRRIHLWGFVGSAVAWLVWLWMDGSDWTMRGLLIVCALQVWVAIAANLAWAKKIAGSVLSDWSEFEKVLRSQFQDDQENAMLKDLDGELASGYAHITHIKGSYLTKSWLIRLDLDVATDNRVKIEPIIIMNLSRIMSAELVQSISRPTGPIVGAGSRRILIEFNDLTYTFCFRTFDQRKEFLDALIERRPDLPLLSEAANTITIS